MNKAWPPSGLDNGTGTLPPAPSPANKPEGLRAVWTTVAQARVATRNAWAPATCRLAALRAPLWRTHGWTTAVAWTGAARSGMRAESQHRQTGCTGTGAPGRAAACVCRTRVAVRHRFVDSGRGHYAGFGPQGLLPMTLYGAPCWATYRNTPRRRGATAARREVMTSRSLFAWPLGADRRMGSGRWA